MIPFIWCYAYNATFGIAKEWSDRYQFPMPVPPEIEIELSITEDKGYKWDWTMRGLREIIEMTVNDAITIGNITEDERQETLDAILAPARDSDMMADLQDRFPLLNVRTIPDELIAELTQDDDLVPFVRTTQSAQVKNEQKQVAVLDARFK